ncbi:MAG: alpha/beta hydrolase [Melioribacteraceae bacterium]|nr:alpha/beta hydrolase [Melioribacteraceae bacterium]
MKPILLLLILLLINNVYAQEIAVPLWSDGVPNYQKTDEVEIVDDNENIQKVSYVQEPNITVYKPAKRNTTGESVVICPGGGYWILAYDWEGSDIAKYFNSKGITAIVLKYRLPVSKSNVVPHKSPLMDAQRAIRLTRFHAGEWGLDSNKIGIMGFSAGGHLASTAGTHFDYGNKNSDDMIERISCRPDFMILMYPVISFVADFSHTGSANALLGENPTRELLEFYSNELHVTENTPPTILIHSQDDTGVPIENSLNFYKALTDKKVSAEMHLYPFGGHGFSLALGNDYLSTWPDRVVDWLKRVTNKKSQ